MNDRSLKPSNENMGPQTLPARLYDDTELLKTSRSCVRHNGGIHMESKHASANNYMSPTALQESKLLVTKEAELNDDINPCQQTITYELTNLSDKSGHDTDDRNTNFNSKLSETQRLLSGESLCPIRDTPGPARTLNSGYSLTSCGSSGEGRSTSSPSESSISTSSCYSSAGNSPLIQEPDMPTHRADFVPKTNSRAARTFFYLTHDGHVTSDVTSQHPVSHSMDNIISNNDQYGGHLQRMDITSNFSQSEPSAQQQHQQIDHMTYTREAFIYPQRHNDISPKSSPVNKHDNGTLSPQIQMERVLSSMEQDPTTPKMSPKTISSVPVGHKIRRNSLNQVIAGPSLDTARFSHVTRLGGEDDDMDDNLEVMVAKFKDIIQQNNAQSISVKQLRHYIPMLIMATFECRPEPMLKKVKGMWTSPPTGWPSEVPFCDPNNGQKVHGKPRKDVLMKMFQYLVKLYSEQHSTNTQRRGSINNQFTESAANLKTVQPSPMKHTVTSDRSSMSHQPNAAAAFQSNPSRQQLPNPLSDTSFFANLISSASVPKKPNEQDDIDRRGYENLSSHVKENSKLLLRHGEVNDQSQQNGYEQHKLAFSLSNGVTRTTPYLHTLLTTSMNKRPMLRSESFPLNRSMRHLTSSDVKVQRQLSNEFNEPHYQYDRQRSSSYRDDSYDGDKSHHQTHEREHPNEPHPIVDRQSVFNEEAEKYQNSKYPTEYRPQRHQSDSGIDTRAGSLSPLSIRAHFQIDGDILENTISSKIMEVFDEKQSPGTKVTKSKTYSTKKSRIFDKLNERDLGLPQQNMSESPSKSDESPIDYTNPQCHSRVQANSREHSESSSGSSCSENSLEKRMCSFAVTADKSPPYPSPRKSGIDLHQSDSSDMEAMQSPVISSTPSSIQSPKARKRSSSDSAMPSACLPSSSSFSFDTNDLHASSRDRITRQLAQRIINKMYALEYQVFLTSREKALLNSVLGMILREDVLSTGGVRWLHTAHALDNTLDTVEYLQYLPTSHSVRWQNFTVACLVQGSENVNMDYTLNITEMDVN